MRSSSSSFKQQFNRACDSCWGIPAAVLPALLLCALTLHMLGFPPRSALANTNLFMQPSKPEPGVLELMLEESPPYTVTTRVLKGTFKRAQTDMGSFASCYSRLTVALNAVSSTGIPQIISLSEDAEEPDANCTAVIRLVQDQLRQCNITAPATADSVITCEDKPLQLLNNVTIQRPGYRFGAY